VFLLITAWLIKTSVLTIGVICLLALLPFIQVTRKVATTLGLQAYTFFIGKKDT